MEQLQYQLYSTVIFGSAVVDVRGLIVGIVDGVLLELEGSNLGGMDESGVQFSWFGSVSGHPIVCKKELCGAMCSCSSIWG